MGLAVCAGVIHVVATLEHVARQLQLGGFFALAAAVQLTGAWWIHHMSQERHALLASACASAAIAVIWILSCHGPAA